MTIRSTLFLAGVAVATMATPAAAHEGHHAGQHEVATAETHDGTYDGDWQGHWQDDQTWRGMWNGTYTSRDGEVLEGRYLGTFIGEGRFVSDDGQVLELDEVRGWHARDRHYGLGHHRNPHRLSASPDGRLGYTLAEREAWLADCRLVMGGGNYGYYEDRGGDGDLVGGLLGAVVGGVAGNRIAGSGDRLLGTVIGAGVGGIAGAVIGDAVDGDGRHGPSANEIYAARYCDAYLRRYEMGGGAGFHGQAQPVMMVQMVGAPMHGQRGHRHGPECTTTVREEWVEVEAPAPRPARREIPPRPQPEPAGKITPIE
ncbi:glycine zipper 2TM domain-containing protein [Aurantiacibacter gilvus]|uniref:17 kDa surface antigen n=1 Tax=Aurantiacibacter gilvus TaxID=3139141 RepID=A0ABU9IHY6_9SPHN